MPRTSNGMSSLPSCANTAPRVVLGPSRQGNPGVEKVSFSPVQCLQWFLICWECFISPEIKSDMDKDRQTSLFDAAPHYTDLVLQCSLSLCENKNCDAAAFLKTASPTKDNRQSLGEQHIENHFPSIQKAPPEIPVENWEQLGISKQHHNMSKHTAKNTAAHWIWYTSSTKQVCEHKTMQQDITPGKAEREQCCIWTLLRYFLLEQAGHKPCQAIPFLPRAVSVPPPAARLGQAPEGQSGSSSAHWPITVRTAFCYQ